VLDGPEFKSSSHEPPSLRFSQIVQVGSGDDTWLVGLTPQGELYHRYYDEDYATMLWRPAPAISTSSLEDNLRCSGCGIGVDRAFPHERCAVCRKGFLLPEV